jgi:hypothetical protein
MAGTKDTPLSMSCKHDQKLTACGNPSIRGHVYCRKSFGPRDHVHVHVIYFSVNLLQDMEIVVLKNIKRIWHIEYKYTKIEEKNYVNKK